MREGAGREGSVLTGEISITHINTYIGWNKMRYGILNGWWTDAETFGSLLWANQLVNQLAAEREYRKARMLEDQDAVMEAGRP